MKKTILCALACLLTLCALVFYVNQGVRIAREKGIIGAARKNG